MNKRQLIARHCFEKRLKGLKPIIDSNAKVLILGSFPSKEALKKRKYYANPRNQFWRIMEDLFNNGNKIKNYRDKKRLLFKNKISVWDVIKSCYREGNNDNAITREQLNDINGLLIKHPDIKAIFFNGRKAERLFKEGLNNLDLPLKYLPSTSGALPMSYEEKKNKWRKILKFICSN